jgi:beta-glucanase (GH16 family)
MRILGTYNRTRERVVNNSRLSSATRRSTVALAALAALAVLLGLATLGPARVALGQSAAVPHARTVPKKPVLQPPRVVSATQVRLKGAARQRKVVVQVRWGSSWQRAKTLKVRKNAFTTLLARRAQAGKVRVVAGRLRSRAYPIPATPAAPAPGVSPGRAEPADACGPRPRKADGTYWSCTFHDDFSGTELDRTLWTPQTNFKSGELELAYACYLDDPENISVSGGALHLTLRKDRRFRLCLKDNLLPTQYTSGMVSTYHGFSQQYGRFEARYSNTAATVPGLQETFWLWPDDRYQKLLDLWPAAGEIDVSETYSQYPTLTIPFLHYTWNDNGGPRPGVNTAWNCQARRGVYTTYTVEWSPSRIEIFVDGKSCLVNTSGDKAFQKPYIVALTMLLGAGANRPTAATPLPATMSVDYVRVWE